MEMRGPFGRRLGLVLGAVLFFATIGSVDAVIAIHRIEADAQAVLRDHVQTERDLADWMQLSSTNLQRSIAIAHSSDNSLAGHFAPALATTTARITALQGRIEQHMRAPDETALCRQVHADRAQYLQARDEVMRLKRAGEHVAARQWLSQELEPRATTYMASVKALSDDRRGRLDSAVDGIRTASGGARRTLAVCVAVAALAGVSLAWLLSRQSVPPRPEGPAGATS